MCKMIPVPGLGSSLLEPTNQRVPDKPRDSSVTIVPSCETHLNILSRLADSGVVRKRFAYNPRVSPIRPNADTPTPPLVVRADPKVVLRTTERNAATQ